MATRTFNDETYRKIGSPDLNSKMFYINGKTGEKVWGKVIAIDFKKDGVKIRIKPFK